VIVARCIIGRGRGDYAMTVAGSGQAWRSRGWVIEDNEFDGSLEIVWSDDITVLRNHSTNSTDKPSLQVYRACNRITVGFNSFVLSGPASAVIAVTGTGLDQAPDHVVIDSNIIRSSDPGAHGVHITCARNTLVRDNAIVGAGVPDLYAAGVYARTTVTEEPIQSVVVRDNQISNWGKYGVALGGNGDAIIRRVDVSDNIFDDASTPHTMTSAMALPVAQTVSISNNILLGGCVTEIAVTPPGRLMPTNGLSWVP
jgi:hypothetical protein